MSFLKIKEGGACPVLVHIVTMVCLVSSPASGFLPLSQASGQLECTAPAGSSQGYKETLHCRISSLVKDWAPVKEEVRAVGRSQDGWLVLPRAQDCRARKQALDPLEGQTLCLCFHITTKGGCWANPERT